MSRTELPCLKHPIISSLNSADAFQLAKNQSPFLIILDLFLPGTNTIELLASLKKLDTIAPPKVIVISSLGYQEVIQKAIAAGANDFIVKPFSTDEFIERAKNLIAQSK